MRRWCSSRPIARHAEGARMDQPLRGGARRVDLAVAYTVGTGAVRAQRGRRIWFIASAEPVANDGVPSHLLVSRCSSSSRCVRCAVWHPRGGVAGQYLAALAGGFMVFLIVQYGLLFSTNRMLSFHIPTLRTIISINFVPLMFRRRRVDVRVQAHRSPLPGALVCACFVAQYGCQSGKPGCMTYRTGHCTLGQDHPRPHQVTVSYRLASCLSITPRGVGTEHAHPGTHRRRCWCWLRPPRWPSDYPNKPTRVS
jgi:hypothetical protein